MVWILDGLATHRITSTVVEVNVRRLGKVTGVTAENPHDTLRFGPVRCRCGGGPRVSRRGFFFFSHVQAQVRTTFRTPDGGGPTS